MVIITVISVASTAAVKVSAGDRLHDHAVIYVCVTVTTQLVRIELLITSESDGVSVPMMTVGDPIMIKVCGKMTRLCGAFANIFDQGD